MSKKEDDYIRECTKKYKLAIDNENENRMRWIDDMRFAHVPGYQWPSELRSLRENPSSPRPCIEINVTAQHVYQVTNDIRQNMPTVKTRPVAMDASTDVAEVYDGIIRHIHSCSKFNIAINVAANHSVTAGWGYIRILTEYVNKAENEQEIRIKAVNNPLSCVFDAASMCPVGSDALCAWVVDDMPKSKFESTYGKKLTKEAGQWQGEDDGGHNSDWVTKDTVRVCEYFERLEREVTVYEMMNGSELSEKEFTKRFELNPLVAQQVIKTEQETEFYVKWTKLTSFKILDEREFPSQYIPLIRVPGLVVDIEGTRYYKGLVRDAKDAQRVLNYNWSNFVESGALQPKVPFIGAAGQFDGYEAEWGMANSANLPYLEYNSKDANDMPQLAPQRQQMQMVSQGLMTGVQMAKDAMKEVTGQYNASLGQQSNETSGRAIIARQHEGDTATYHFIDGVQMAIEHLGKIEIDMAPRIYDTKRVMRILGEDDSTQEVRLDPTQPEAMRETQMSDGSIEKIYNLNVGRYDVIATVGPSFTTKRAEAVEAMTQIMQGNQQIFPLIGDVWVRNQDWPGGDEISDRLKTLLPPQIQEQEKTGMKIPPKIAQQMQQMQQQIQQMQQALQQTQQALQQAQAGNEAKIQSSQIQAQQRMQEAQLQAETDVQVARIQMEAKAQIAQMEAQIKAQTEIMKPHPPQVYESVRVPPQ